MKVSVIMSFSDRVTNLRRTLTSWAHVDYPDVEFIFTDNGSKNKQGVLETVDNFKQSTKRIVTFSRNENIVAVNRVWNRAAKETSEGEYVVFAMADEIVTPDVINNMVPYQDQRCSINTYFLGASQTDLLDTIDWESNPRVIESIPGFGDFEYKGSVNRDKKDASLLSHVTGWSRKQWEWFGWFRTNDKGHLWLDQDIVIRERVLGLTAQTVGSCYHQWHPEIVNPAYLAPGYHPVNERQARLLEESERDFS